MKRDQNLILAVSANEKEGFRQAADLAGIGLSSWARERLRSAAIRELQEVGRKIPFVKPIILTDSEDGE